MNTLVTVSAAACVLSTVLTYLVRKAAFRLGVVDRPDGIRKLQRKPVPLGGGVAIFLAFVITVLGLFYWPSPWQEDLRSEWDYYAGFLLSAGCICVLGLFDDRFNLRGRQKLFGQIAAISVLIASGLIIRKFTIFEWGIDLGLLSVPFTMFWMLGAINALNLIDGVDGLATSIGIVFSLTLATMAFLLGHEVDALIALALAGSLAGFLIFNFPPARMYLGDSGSMLIGLILGALAIRSSLKGPATVALAAPTAVWTVLILDVSMAIVRRKLTGRSVYATDRSHLHHTLLRKGFSGTRILIWVGLLCVFCAVGALASISYQNDLLAIGSAVAVVGVSVMTGLFGRSECALMFRSGRAFLMSILRFPSKGSQRAEPISSRLHGDREWDSLWDALTEFAERFDLYLVQLNVNLPALHEEYHAVWRRKQGADYDGMWHATIPLVGQHQVMGRLRLAGQSPPDESVSRWMAELIEGLKPFEEQVQQLAATPPVRRAEAAPRKSRPSQSRTPVSAAVKPNLPVS
ncbi:MAG: undecaprenyl/decaprenyl-phosphate alpha-N-acetylglucosaminyl 1-phosphate transferase [Planctomycetaceae bacterium]|nr:undecaprenyl/decaprenyl-phosphate alpha-N-acetylglucosaminyl 1-phosphate transferase [Planctomycetaceae bacterium]